MPNVARRKRYPRKRYDELTVRWSNAPPCSIALTLFPLPSSNDDPRVDALLDNEQLAAVIGASPDYIRNEGHKLLPVVKLGARARYRLRDVVELIERSTLDRRKLASTK